MALRAAANLHRVSHVQPCSVPGTSAQTLSTRDTRATVGIACRLRRGDSRAPPSTRQRGVSISRHLGNLRRLRRVSATEGAGPNETGGTSVLDTSASAASSEGQAGNPRESDSSASASPADSRPAEPVTKDVLALRNLDAYFEKLKGPEKEKEEKEKARQAVAAATASPAADTKTTESQPADAQKDSEDKKQSTNGASGDITDEEVMALLKKLMATAPASKDASGNSKDQPQFQMSGNLGMQSDYQRWLDAQQLIRPASALNILLAINVAVFLFELASPEAVPGLIVTSLPSLLGAKVNALISAGEWWRLVTPMFLHAGFFHILLGSVVLLSFGPSVEVAFGSFGFFAAYFVGGVYGNLLSFLQTADVTVGGTGPLYGLVGAYIVYLWKNKEAIGKEEAEGSMWSLIFFAALNVALGSSLPIDDWTHIGGALGGLLFGALAAPTLTRVPIEFSKTDYKKSLEAFTGIPAPKSDDEKVGEGSGSESAEVEKGGTLFLLEGPGPKRYAWIMAACLGIAAVLLDFSTTGIPDSLLNVSDQFNTFTI